ncbi:MAG: hypothetical protein LBT16_05995 [Treponema sp.]|jgi:hypothetical protein|nr:hypothetical protein [Treponema sp.]
MPNSKPLITAIGVTLILSAFTLVLSWVILPEKGGAPGTFAPVPGGAATPGYALLTVDEAFPGRDVLEALKSSGLANTVCESTQWVFLDDFGELKRIPLDEYDETVEAFDPRNDGYAEKLRRFFAGDGERRFFIPFPSGLPPSSIESRVISVLEIPFSLDFFQIIKPPSRLWPSLLFAAGILAVLLITALRPGGKGMFGFLVMLLPLQAVFIFSGPGGFAFSACLFAVFENLLPPLREGFARLRYFHREEAYEGEGLSSSGLKPVFFRIFLRKQGIFKINWCMGALFFLAACLIAFLGSLNPLMVVLVLLSFFIILGTALRAESYLGRFHIRFTPLPIRTPAFTAARFPRIVIPFAFASIAALFLPWVGSVSGPGHASQALSPPLLASRLPVLDSRDYEEHFAFQSSFSTRPLDGFLDEGSRPRRSGAEDERGSVPYRSYFLGEDGLIAGSREAEGVYGPADEAPPYPLKELAAFLEGRGEGRSRGNTRGDIIAALGALALAIPALFRTPMGKRKMGSFLVYNNKGDKQVAA